MALLVLFAALALLGVAAQAWGVDSRIMNPDADRPTSGPGLS